MGYMENKKNQISKNVKTMVDIRILEGTRDLRIFRTNKKGMGYTTPKIPFKATSQDHREPIFFKPTTYLPCYLPTLK